MVAAKASSSSVTATNTQSTVGSSIESTDEAWQLLQLAARLHTARGNPDAWREVLATWRNCFDCGGILGMAADGSQSGPDELEALAGRLTHCVTYGDDCGADDQVRRRRCGAFALHLHAAALAVRQAHQAALFDHLPPTWIVDRDGHVREANAGSKALTRVGERFLVVGGRLEPVAPGRATSLRKALAEASGDTRISWKDQLSGDTTLLLRVLSDCIGVAVTLLPEPPGSAEVAPMLAEHLGLTVRQSELGAHLLAGHTLADAARVMGISRNTTNEHLVALLRRAGAPDRKTLLTLLRRVVHR